MQVPSRPRKKINPALPSPASLASHCTECCKEETPAAAGNDISADWEKFPLHRTSSAGLGRGSRRAILVAPCSFTVTLFRSDYFVAPNNRRNGTWSLGQLPLFTRLTAASRLWRNSTSEIQELGHRGSNSTAWVPGKMGKQTPRNLESWEANSRDRKGYREGQAEDARKWNVERWNRPLCAAVCYTAGDSRHLGLSSGRQLRRQCNEDCLPDLLIAVGIERELKTCDMSALNHGTGV